MKQTIVKFISQIKKNIVFICMIILVGLLTATVLYIDLIYFNGIKGLMLNEINTIMNFLKTLSLVLIPLFLMIALSRKKSKNKHHFKPIRPNEISAFQPSNSINKNSNYKKKSIRDRWEF